MVYLIGAGPGEPGLITWKGIEILKRCDAVIYDRLGTGQLLAYLPAGCKKICVGKQAGEHSARQEEIHKILLDAAECYNCVVRLKGGDPFVFGRGGEEAQMLAEHHIPFQIVPGVTSAVAVPECAGIPVTHREISRSFHVITGHTSRGMEEALAHIHPQPEGTTVFLMGLSNLSRIVEKLLLEGESEDTPAAVISQGTLPGEQVIRGTLADIAGKVEQSQMVSPAVIVVGQTASCQFVSGETGICSGLHIGLIATLPLREKLQDMCERLGARAYSVCDMEVVPAEGMAGFTQEIHRLGQYDWVAFTSQNAIGLFFERLRQEEIDLRSLSHLKFAVVGEGTKAALWKQGFRTDYMPERYTTTALAEGLCGRIAPAERILLPRAKQGNPQLTEILGRAGVETVEFSIYDVKCFSMPSEAYLGKLDFLVFVSASGVREFFDNLREQDKTCLRENKKLQFAVLGNVTEQALKEYGYSAGIVPERNDIQGLEKAFVDEMRKGAWV